MGFPWRTCPAGPSALCSAPPVLADFDRRVNDNKTAAEEALRRVPAINRTIAEANEKTQGAQLALGNAAADATEAKHRAHEAERIASAVQKVSCQLPRPRPQLHQNCQDRGP